MHVIAQRLQRAVLARIAVVHPSSKVVGAD